MPAPAHLRLSDVSKHFDGLVALDGVGLELRGGEVHALLGENGAGKTTLMNVLYGLILPDRGTIALDGRPVHPRSPAEARRLGIGMVHQHFTVIERLTAAENLALTLPSAGPRFAPEPMAASARALAARIGLDIGDPHTRVGTLAVGARQRLEILKALAIDVRVLILDEPTAVLTPQEVEQLFAVLRRLRDDGCAVVFISHKLREVRAIADRVTVLRHGRVVGSGTLAELTDEELATLMVGGTPRPRHGRAGGVGSAIADQGRGRGPRPTEVLALEGVALAAGRRGVHLCVRGGEVVGVVGVDGNGQQELFEILAGLRAPAGGRVSVRGHTVSPITPARMLAAGIGLIPPDRRADGLAPTMTTAENLMLHRVLLDRFSHRGWLAREALQRYCEAQAARYQVRRSALGAPAATLSGGNQQRVIVARALAGEPAVLVAFNPTRGLDIAASRAVYDAIEAFVGAGNGVLLVSTDLDEALEMSDRLAVLYRHQLSAPLAPPFPLERLGLLMATGEA